MFAFWSDSKTTDKKSEKRESIPFRVVGSGVMKIKAKDILEHAKSQLEASASMKTSTEKQP